MGKGIALKDALVKWSETYKPADEKVVRLNGWTPFINKLDASLATLTNCERFSVSTNMIEKLSNLHLLTKVKIFSVGRNHLKNLNGIEALAETLEQLWVSYNNIEKLKPVSNLKNLKVLYMSNNSLKDIKELKHLAKLSNLEDLVLKGCPIQEKRSDEDYRKNVLEILPQLTKLDGSCFEGKAAVEP